ncbi:TonB-dependent receptor [Sphingomonas piscis]|uniref:TonB-dependent receptor n=1 Tax=Sphingomonas piscis TaxID=2714943 RepID=A0A6G7YP82_9SPHN|nr:TonB-dependent receptor [Sphingomonas piscis]QIK78550.1 TonB-dependent receptor [Sphingomonas piscis]
MRKSVWLLSAGLIAISIPAHAQQTDTDNQAAQPTDGATSEAAAVDDQAVEQQPVNSGDIVVTATRRNEALSDVPLAVSAVTADTLENSGATDIRALSQVSPSLFVSSSSTEAGGASARIRGIGTVGDNPGLESSVGLFVDGVYRSRTSVGLTELGAVERVEVLRGPQGTLFGRNTSAGLISVITAKPRFTSAVNGQLDIGNYKSRRVELGVTGPISETLAGRIDGVYFKRDGFMKDAVSGRDINDRNRWLLRGQLLYQPDDDLSVRVIADKTHRDEECCVGSYLPTFDTVASGGGSITQAPSTVAAALRAAGATINEDTFDREVSITPGRTFRADVDDYGISSEVVYDRGWGELTWISAFRENKYVRGQDADFNQLDIIYRDDGFASNRFRTFSQEARLQGTTFGGKLDWLVGVYYANELLRVRDNLSFGADADLFGRTLVRSLDPQLAAFPGYNNLNAFVRGFATQQLALNPAFAAVPAAARPLIVNAIGAQVQNTPLSNTGTRDEFNQESSNIAAFTHNIFKITDRLSATVGLRYTREKKSLSADLFSNTQCGTYRANIARLQAFAANPGLGPLSPAAAALANAIATGVGTTPGLSAAGGVPCAINSVNGTFDNGRKSESRVSGTAVLSYKPTDELLTYVSYSRGYKAGGFNLDRNGLSQGATNLDALGFEPEMVNAYELGGKYNGRGIDLNVALFRQDFDNFQLNTFNGLIFVVENINSCSESLNGADTDSSNAAVACGGKKKPGVRSQGVELEGFVRLIPDVTAAFGATYANTKYRNNLVGANGNAIAAALFQLPGQRVSNSSEWSLTGSLGWRPSLGNGLRGLFYADARHMSGFNTGSDLDVEKYQEAFTVVNARVGVHAADERWALELWAQNLFDEEYKQVAFDAPLQGQGTTRGVAAGFYPRSTQLYGAFLGEPRTFGVTLRGKM